MKVICCAPFRWFPHDVSSVNPHPASVSGSAGQHMTSLLCRQRSYGDFTGCVPPANGCLLHPVGIPIPPTSASAPPPRHVDLGTLGGVSIPMHGLVAVGTPLGPASLLHSSETRVSRDKDVPCEFAMHDLADAFCASYVV